MEVAHEDSAIHSSIWACSRRHFRRPNIVQHISPFGGTISRISCAAGLYGHSLPASKKRIIDRCRHNDPSLMCLKWENGTCSRPLVSEIESCTFCDGLELSLLAHALFTNHHVRTLDVSGYRLSSRAIHSMAELFEQNGTLVHIILDQTALGDKGIELISKSLSRNHSLRILSMRRVEMSWIGVVSLAAALTKNLSLTTLDIRDNYIYQKGARALARGLCLNRSSKITSLDMQSTAINSRGVEALMEILSDSGCYQLQHLNLCNNFAGASGISTVANALILNRTLTILNLSGNMCKNLALKTGLQLADFFVTGGDEGAIKLARAIRINRSLAQMNLSLNDIKDEGACSIASALQWNTALQHVDISMNKISSIGLRAISLALVVNNQIVSLDVGSNISDAIIQGCFTYEICRRLKQNRSRMTLTLELGIILSCTESDTWRSAKQYAAQLPNHSCASCFECRRSSVDEDDCKNVLDRIWSFYKSAK